MTNEGQTNGAGALAKLLNQVNLPTLALIMIMGGGNWWETKTATGLNLQEIQRATAEIHDLYPKLEEAIARQKQLQLTINDIKEQTRGQNER